MEIYRGDIFYVKGNGGKSIGSEQKPDRPAVVVSNNKANEHSPVVEVVYLTTQEKKPLPTHVEVLCKVPSIALCEQVHSVFVDRLDEYIKTCTDEEMEAIDRALMVSLGLNPDVTCNESDDSQIDDLKMKLEGAERMHEEMIAKYENERDICNSLQKELSELADERDALERKLEDAEDRFKYEKGICHTLQMELDELKKQPIFSPDSDEVVRLKAQIEVLEKQNERLLDRLIG